MNERSYGLSDEPAGRDFSRWLLDELRHLAVAWRPHLGWAALLLCMVLAMLPAALVWENGWLRGGPLMMRLYMAGPLAVLCVWIVGGWRRPATWGRRVVPARRAGCRAAVAQRVPAEPVAVRVAARRRNAVAGGGHA